MTKGFTSNIFTSIGDFAANQVIFGPILTIVLIDTRSSPSPELLTIDTTSSPSPESYTITKLSVNFLATKFRKR